MKSECEFLLWYCYYQHHWGIIKILFDNKFEGRFNYAFSKNIHI